MANKATKLNRGMGFGILALGIVVLAIVTGMLYFAFENQGSNDARPAAAQDTLILIDHTAEADSAASEQTPTEE